MSTIHAKNQISTGNFDWKGIMIQKLDLIKDCNKHMCGVEKNDTTVESYSYARESCGWTVFFHYIKESIFNFFIIYQKSGGEKRFLAFKLAVIENMLQEAQVITDFAEGEYNKYTWHHFPELVPPTQSKEKQQKHVLSALK